MKRIHIVGLSPRTGTTLMAECMAACFEIDAFEPHEAALTRVRRDANVYLTKSPDDLLSIAPRLQFDRHFHVICMMRDPRDVVVSRHGRRPSHYWTPLRIWKRRAQATDKLMGRTRFLMIRYEDFVREPDATQMLIQRHMPFLAPKQRFSEYHAVADPSPESLRALNGVRAIDAASIGRWRDHLPRLAGQLQRHGPITRELIEFGYEQDASWLAMLEGVEPDLKPSSLREHISAGQRWRLWRRPIIKGFYSAALVLGARAIGIKLV